MIVGFYFYQVRILLNGGLPPSIVDDAVAITNRFANAISYVDPVADIFASGIQATNQGVLYVVIDCVEPLAVPIQTNWLPFKTLGS